MGKSDQADCQEQDRDEGEGCESCSGGKVTSASCWSFCFCTVKKQNDQHEADVIKLTELREEDKNQQEATRGRMTNLEWRSRAGHSAS